MRRNHERDWPGTVDQRSALANNVDSGGECGVIYDKRLGLGMPIVKRASAGLTLTHDPSHIDDHDTLHAARFAFTDCLCACKRLQASELWLTCVQQVGMVTFGLLIEPIDA